MPSISIASWAAVNDTETASAVGQIKRPFSRRLIVQAQPLAVPPQHLDPVTPAAAEDEDLARERIGFDGVLDHGGQPIETPAHVGDPGD